MVVSLGAYESLLANSNLIIGIGILVPSFGSALKPCLCLTGPTPARLALVVPPTPSSLTYVHPHYSSGLGPLNRALLPASLQLGYRRGVVDKTRAKKKFMFAFPSLFPSVKKTYRSHIYVNRFPRDTFSFSVGNQPSTPIARYLQSP